MSKLANTIQEGTVKWTKAEVDTFVTAMLEEVKKGNKTTATFNKHGWENIKTSMELKLGRSFKLLQLRNKMNKLRSDYSSFKRLLECSGFGWIMELRTVDPGHESLWDRVIKENPSWAKFRKNGLPQWPELEMIFGDSYASGDGQVGNAEPPPTEFEFDDQGLDSSPQGSTGVGGDPDVGDVEGDTSNDVHRQNRTPNAIRKRGRGSELSVAIRDMCHLSRLRMERHNSSNSLSLNSGSTSYSVGECIKVLDGMLEKQELEKNLYMKAINRAMENKEWREAFICFNTERRMWLLEQL